MIPLEQMTPEQKLGRVLCARKLSDKDNVDFTLELVKRGACGAIQMPFNENTKDLIKLFRKAADYPLLIINDMETKFPLSKLPPVPLMTLAATGNVEYIRAFAASIAKEAKEYGYSGVWSPVVDLQTGNGPCSVGRKLSDDPMVTAEFAKEMLRVFDSYAFHGTAKHYPGSSGLRRKGFGMDGHMVEVTCRNTEEELLNGALIPYFELMKEGLLPAIMVGHHVLPKIDSLPASLSKKVIDIIRRQGFDGVCYTDSLAMMAILQKYGEQRAMEMAIMAGNDIILPNYRTKTKDVYEMVLASYREGRITDERLDEAVRRVMKLEEYCAREPVSPYPVPENIEEVMDNIARDCITADCHEGVSPAIDTQKSRLFVVVVDQEEKIEDGTPEISMNGWYSSERVCRAIAERFPNARIERIHEFPTARDNDRLLTIATEYDEVVFSTYCTTSAYLGTDGLTRRLESVIAALAIPEKISAIVHFGNPLALETVPAIENVPRIIYGYKSPYSQNYAFDVLAGKIEAKGRFPFPSLYSTKRTKDCDTVFEREC